MGTSVRRTLGTLSLLLTLMLLSACGGRAAATTEMRQEVTPETAPARCSTPSPASARGYSDLFATVDEREFGAADVGISVRLSDGRVVWLWGDTFSVGRFVHSTAITQDRGCLHVSHGGAQLLPNDDAHHIYWIESAKAVRGGLAIRARSVVLTGTGAWAFKDGGFSRVARARVDRAGNVTFVRWGMKLTTPAPDPGPLYPLPGECHFGYTKHTHPEAHLTSGKTLVTMAQGWDCGPLRPFSEYRVLWSEQ